MIVGHIGGGTSSPYEIQKSLRFRANASAYLSRTPSVAGNRKTWTWSGWIKRGTLGSQQDLFISGSNVSSNLSMQISFTSSDIIRVYASLSGVSNDILLDTSAVYRDPSAWYHVVVLMDTTQATASNRTKLYVNGSQVTAFSTATYSAQNYATSTNNTVAHTIGRFTHVSANYFDGYLSEINFIDGQALDPSYFGEVSAETGAWIPKKYTGTYGTNGFYLPFNDGSNLTNLTADRSGNGNNWTPNNISTTAGATYDWMDDTPTNNFAVLNPLNRSTGTAAANLYDGNLRVSPSGGVNATPGAYALAASTFQVSSGKWYFESQVVNPVGGYGANAGWTNSVTFNFNQSSIYTSNITQVSASMGNTSLRMIAYDASAGKVWTGTNGTWDSGDPATGTGGSSLTSPAMPFVQAFQANSSNQCDVVANFGQRPFAYSPPTGFKALCTKNLPEVPASLLDPTDHHIDITVTKSGDTNFTLPWDASVYDTFFEIKRRDASGDWYQIDGLRGYDKILKSNSTAAETTDANVLGVSGTTCTLKSTLPNGVYIISATKAGLSSARQTNTDGSITSTVSANVEAGFSIVLYTSTGVAGTIGHALGNVPSLIISHKRSSGGATNRNWPVRSKPLCDAFGNSECVFLNLTTSRLTQANIYTATAPTTSVYSVGTDNEVNESSGYLHVAYCYADSAIQKSFSYTGNGSTDGPYVNLGFKCGSVLIKETNTSSYSWNVVDTARDTYNTQGLYLFANTNAAEGSASYLDFLALGFKPRNLGAGINGSTLPYIGHAWAAVTGKYSNAR